MRGALSTLERLTLPLPSAALRFASEVWRRSGVRRMYSRGHTNPIPPGNPSAATSVDGALLVPNIDPQVSSPGLPALPTRWPYSPANIT
eukprot:CAMPEP_0196592932 /NCGR_PEP_ID=MMETSP1081-20130531/74224_1 /TAXON_ID=36882 /ORGANISM="Pyramimonas amylifera, Strain CCMP720" /LENGTH=88 /DNA_ID=CAMNT_0041916759 /DNA_START=878 /DNA_END=1140 /DNA_ORIENTATION=+